MKQPMFNMGLMMAARAAVARLLETGVMKVPPAVGRTDWMIPSRGMKSGKTRPHACHKLNPSGTKIIRRTLARKSGRLYGKKTCRALDGTLR